MGHYLNKGPASKRWVGPAINVEWQTSGDYVICYKNGSYFFRADMRSMQTLTGIATLLRKYSSQSEHAFMTKEAFARLLDTMKHAKANGSDVMPGGDNPAASGAEPAQITWKITGALVRGFKGDQLKQQFRVEKLRTHNDLAALLRRYSLPKFSHISKASIADLLELLARNSKN